MSDIGEIVGGNLEGDHLKLVPTLIITVPRTVVFVQKTSQQISKGSGVIVLGVGHTTSLTFLHFLLLCLEFNGEIRSNLIYCV